MKIISAQNICQVFLANIVVYGVNKFKCIYKHMVVRTDQGGKLRKSFDFQEMVTEEGFIIELTGADTCT